MAIASRWYADLLYTFFLLLASMSFAISTSESRTASSWLSWREDFEFESTNFSQKCDWRFFFFSVRDFFPLSSLESVRRCFEKEKNFWKNWAKRRLLEENGPLLLTDLPEGDDIFRNWLVNSRSGDERSIVFITKKFSHSPETDKNRFFEIVLISIFDLPLSSSIRAEIVVFDKRVRLVGRIDFVSLNERIPPREANCEFRLERRIRFQTNFKKFV